MRRALCYLLRTILPAATAVVAAFAFGGLLITYFSGTAEGLFYTYYRMFPSITVFAGVIFLMSVSSTSANLALSMGCARRDFYLAVQGLILTFALISVLMGAVVIQMPVWLDALWLPPVMEMKLLPTLLLAVLLGQEVGAFGGFYAGRHRWLMVVFFILATVLLGASTVLFMVMRFHGGEVPQHAVLWIDLAVAALAVVFAALTWRPLSRYTVR